jgi:5'-3' exonuclease
MTNRTLLIDTDTLLFHYGLSKDYAGAATDFPSDETYGGLFVTPESMTTEKAMAAVESKIALLIVDLEATDWRYSFGGQGSFRKQTDATYKAHRKERPEIIKELVHMFGQKYPDRLLEPVAGMEADDILGMAANPDGSTVIVSNDKDFLQIPGYLYNFKKQELLRITGPAANSFLLYQTLVGDSADGYIGCRGIGAAKAHSLLLRAWEVLGHDMDSLWDVVKFTYLSQDQTEDDFIKSAQLAHIYRREDDPTIPWAPPNAVKKLNPKYIKVLKEITKC